MREESTFAVKIYNTENSTWQGELTWMNKGKGENESVRFRSAMEMLKLMEEAVQKDQGEFQKGVNREQ